MVGLPQQPQNNIYIMPTPGAGNSRPARKSRESLEIVRERTLGKTEIRIENAALQLHGLRQLYGQAGNDLASFHRERLRVTAMLDGDPILAAQLENYQAGLELGSHRILADYEAGCER